MLARESIVCILHSVMNVISEAYFANLVRDWFTPGQWRRIKERAVTERMVEFWKRQNASENSQKEVARQMEFEQDIGGRS